MAPAFHRLPEVSQEAPGVSGDTTQNGPGIIVEPGSGTGGQESSQSEPLLRNGNPSSRSRNRGTGLRRNSRTGSGSPPEESTQVPSNQAFLQVRSSGYDLDRSHP